MFGSRRDKRPPRVLVFPQPVTENTMKLRIAVIAACTGTLGFAHADLALATNSDASHLVGSVTSTDIRPEPALVLAQNSSNSNKKAGQASVHELEEVSFTYGRKLQPPVTGRTSKAAEGNTAMGNVSTTRARAGIPVAGDFDGDGRRRGQPVKPVLQRNQTVQGNFIGTDLRKVDPAGSLPQRR
jgi:hypothetical protein